MQNYSDPTINGALRVGVALSAAAPYLKRETATTKSFGFDWDVPVGNRTRLSMSYFDIKYENQVTSYLSDLSVLKREASFAGTGIIQRNPDPALVAQLLATYTVSGVAPATWTLFVDGRNRNPVKSITKGIDFQASTRVPTDSWGNVGLGLSGTYFTKCQAAATSGAPLVDRLDDIYNPLRFKTRFSMNWSLGQWYMNAFANYQNGYANNLTAPGQKVASYTRVDTRVAYEFDGAGVEWLKGTTLALGVVNLFDRKPPFVNVAQSINGGGGFDPTLTNPVGRTMSISLNKRF